jgi:hypothetical protein
MGKVLLTFGLILCTLTLRLGECYPRHKPRPGPNSNHGAQIAQNREIDRLGLTRIKNEKELRTLVLNGSLVPILSSSSLAIDPRLPLNRRYVRPWTKQFLTELSTAYTTRFGRPLTLTSAVRTVRIQSRLLHINHNAAPAHGEEASAHLTGAAVDISRKGMTPEQDRWMESALLEYTVENRVIYLEEHVQPCYHVMVLPDLTSLPPISEYQVPAPMKTIELSKGYWAQVDDEDYDRVNSLNWHAEVSSSTVYARHNQPRVEGRKLTHG